MSNYENLLADYQIISEIKDNYENKQVYYYKILAEKLNEVLVIMENAIVEESSFTSEFDYDSNANKIYKKTKIRN